MRDSIDIAHVFEAGILEIQVLSKAILSRESKRLVSRFAPTTLDTLILASKRFHSFVIYGKLANFISANLVSLHYNIYKNRMELAAFNISDLNWRK